MYGIKYYNIIKYYKGLMTVSILRTYVLKCRQFGFYSLLGFLTKN